MSFARTLLLLLSKPTGGTKVPLPKCHYRYVR